MLGMYEFSLQKTHCQGQTRLVRMVTTRAGPPAALRFQGPVELAAYAPAGRLGPQGAVDHGPLGHRTGPHALDDAREVIRVAHQIDDDLLARTLADLVEFGDGLHLVQRNGGVHAAGEDDAVRVDLLEDLGGFVGARVRVTAHVHEHHLVAGQLLGELVPRCNRPGGEDVRLDAVLVKNGAQQAQAMILPLLVRAVRIDEIAQVAQVEPEDIRGSFSGPRPGNTHDMRSPRVAARLAGGNVA